MSAPVFDVEAIRREFPILTQTVHGKPLVYLDSAASAQKPQVVIDAERNVYETIYANVHRGVHRLSGLATDAYEAVRGKVRARLHARDPREVIFVRGTTEAINLVAQSWGRANVTSGDEILVTNLEHHSNIVPWQMLAAEKSARLVVAPIDDAGEVDLEAYEKLLSPRTRLVAFAHVSNALGSVNPVAQMTALARARGALVLVDGAQGVPHETIDVEALGCDFYAFSAHKAYGPSGVGALWGRREVLEAMPPWQGGGDMILSCSFSGTTYNELPYKFEAGTPDIAGVVAMGAALDWMDRVGLASIAAHERDLLAYGTAALSTVPGLRLVGTAKEKAGVLSFLLEGIHPHDVGTILDYEGIAVRTGHHCAQPVMERFGIPATTRASLACYNTRSELDALVAGLHKVLHTFPLRRRNAMSDLRELYQEIILDHSKRPRNLRKIEGASHTALGHNPLCGDRGTVYLTVEGGIVTDVAFDGSGCSISTASASMMTEAVKGRSLAEVEVLFTRFHELVTTPPGTGRGSAAAAPASGGQSTSSSMEDSGLGKLAVFSGVAEFPMRVKCASLPWHTLHAALSGEGKAQTE